MLKFGVNAKIKNKKKKEKISHIKWLKGPASEVGSLGLILVAGFA